MLSVKQFQRFYRGRANLHCIVPVLAGCVMMCASVTPWLKEPSGKVESALALPVDIGWQFYTHLFNYGLLCLIAALWVFLVSYTNNPLPSVKWRMASSLVGKCHLSQNYLLPALVCLVPLVLFFLQYLLLDVRDINQLEQYKIQELLIELHFGYNITAPHIPVHPFLLDTTTFAGRITLLLDQLAFGVLLPCLAAGILVVYHNARRSSVQKSSSREPRKRHGRRWWIALGLAGSICLALLGRAPLAAFCADEVRISLAVGDYTQATQWLNRELFLDPAVDQLASYHIQRGQISYVIHHDEQSDNSRVYLASVALQFSHYQEAYQHLFGVWALHKSSPWVLFEMDMILGQFSESKQALIPAVDKTLTVEARKYDGALPPLQQLLQIDPSNIYAHYAVGRIEYNLHDYIDSAAQMLQVNQLSTNSDIQSSAYGYIGLSEAGEGNYNEARKFLLQAVALDPHYYNNTAREELSGLH